MSARAPSAADSASRAGLRGVWASISGSFAAGASVLSAAAPWGAWAVDFAWAVGSSALLLALPIVVEIQREATVRVLQHQREVETAQLQDQARAQAGGLLQQAQALGNLIAGPVTPPAAA